MDADKPGGPGAGIDFLEAMTERAIRLWGPERARAARRTIAEAAEHARVIAENPPPDDAAPLFHP